jgi:hypothetical protein
MTSRTAPNIEERLEIAKELALLAPEVELNQDPKRYISLDVGSRPNKNAVVIPKFAQHVSFYIQDPSLVQRLRDAGFSVEAVTEDTKRLYNRDKHRVLLLTKSNISNHKSLITEVLKHSLNVIKNRKAKSN